MLVEEFKQKPASEYCGVADHQIIDAAIAEHLKTP